MRLFRLILLATMLATSAHAQQNPDDTYWQPGVGDLDGAPVYLFDIAADAGRLYVVGGFSAIDGAQAGGIAQWDGSRWQALSGMVRGLVITVAAANGDAYIGGSFYNVSDTAWMSNIARWDGTSLKPMGAGAGAGVAGFVSTIVPHGDDVYVGGSFGGTLQSFDSGMVIAKNVAYWNRTTNQWRALGTGQGPNALVSSIAVAGGDVYVAGAFDTIAGVPMIGLAMFDAQTSSWRQVTTVSLSDTSRPRARIGSLLVVDGSLYVGGRFDSIGGVRARDIAVLDIASGRWSAPIVIDSSAAVGKLQRSGEEIVGLVGMPGNRNIVLRRTAAGVWDTIPTPQSTIDIASANGRLYFGGFYDPGPDSIATRLLYESDGNELRPVPGEFRGDAMRSIHAVLSHGDDLYVAGRFSSVPSMRTNNIARWHRPTGTWHRLGDSAANGVDGSVLEMMLDGDDLWVAGRFRNAGGVTANNVAVWNIAGGTWRSLPSVEGVGTNREVEAIARAGDRIYIGGSFDSLGTLECMGVAYWNREQQRLLPVVLDLPPLVSSVDVDAIVASGDDLYLGGSLRFGSLGGGIGAVHFADETSTVLTPNGLDGYIYDMEVYDGNLIIAGTFDNVEEVAATGVARWDGTSWHSLGEPGLEASNGYVRELLSARGKLLAGGSFSRRGNTTASNIASWDGSHWTSLGSGTVGTVEAMSLAAEGLYVGGDFTIAGGRPAMQLALWSQISLRAPDDNERAVAASIHPNPVHGVAHINFSMRISGNATIAVSDMLGQEIGVIASGFYEAGEHRENWNSSGLASGIYMLTLRTTSGSTSTLVEVVE